MKDYLESLIVEQINRALALKKKIHYPLDYSELTGLAERCTSILDSQILVLKELQKELKNREENDLRDIFREMRVCTRATAWIEYYGIPALYYQTPEIGFLNKLMFRVHKEIKLPLPPPAVCCIATEHYYLNLFTNVIFAPLSESEFLLHLPDLYHELGHYVLENRESELRLKAIKDNFDLAFSKVTDYYNDLVKSKRREFGPEEIPMMIERIHSQWKAWINEFFCDLFALYTVGPAYVWAHLHLIVKKSDDIHELSIFRQTHPSDESRMRILLHGLRNLGFKEHVKNITSRWSEVAKFWGKPQIEYQYAYPEHLLSEIAKLTLNALEQSGFSIISHEALANDEENKIRAMLNEAWQSFWKDEPEKFRNWEEKTVQELKSIV